MGGNFIVPVDTFSRISFRTGENRHRGVGGLDQKNADERIQEAVFCIDNDMSIICDSSMTRVVC